MPTAGATFRKLGNSPLYKPRIPSFLAICDNMVVIPDDVLTVNIQQ